MRSRVLAVGLLLTACASSAQSQSQVEAKLRERAAAHLSLRWLLDSGLAQSDPAGAIAGDRLTMTEVESPLPTLRVFRFRAPEVAHSQSVLLGVVSDSVLDLGGSQSVELGKLFTLVPRQMSPANAIEFSRSLASLTDPAWLSMRSRDIPAVNTCAGLEVKADTIVPRPGGGLGVRVNQVVPIDEHPGCRAIVVAFEYDRDGNLLAWGSRRMPLAP